MRLLRPNDNISQDCWRLLIQVSFDGLRESWKWFLELALPIRLLLGALITAGVGPGFVFLLVEIATYSYSLREGFRPPFEGVIYIQKAAILISFAVTLVSAIFLLVMRKISSYLIYSASLTRNFLAVPNNPRTFWRLIVGLTVTGWGVWSAWHSHVHGTAEYDHLVKYIVLLVVIHVWVVIYIDHYAILVIALLLALHLSLCTLVFVPGNYESFLRFTKYGGGIQVRLNLGNEMQYQDCVLLLRTNQAFICEIDQKVVWEIPAESVRTVVYGTTNAIR